MEREAPTGVVTLVFAEMPDGAARAAGEWESALAERGGYFVKGSARSMLAAFGSAAEAAAFAVEAVSAAAGSGSRLPKFSLHCGRPVCERDPVSGRMDYFGNEANLAARVLAAGHPGQVLLTEAARDLAGAAASDLGLHRLRGIERPERLFLALAPALAGREFPPLATLTALPTNLPTQTSSFVGRERELAGLAAAFEGSRVVVLTGPAGAGKTRVAVRFASDLLASLPGGCWFADLSEEEGPDGAPLGLARALGVPLAGGGGPVRQAGAALALRGPLLVILDTCDLLAAQVGAAVEAWREAAPEARFLLTSRLPVPVGGARELRLEPLAPPPAGAGEEAILASDAVRLFVDRARESKPDFDVTGETARDVAAICAELEGLPLAIELAAARVRIMQPSLIVRRLTRKFELLRSPRQDASRRQQTLEGAIEWSVELLSPWERSAFLQASVFRGGFLTAGANAAIELSEFPEAPSGAEAARRLAARCLLAAQETPRGTRFREYGPLREFAERRWRDEATEEAHRALERRHAAHVLAEGERALADLFGPADVEARSRIRTETPNLLAAADRAWASGGPEGARTAARAILAAAEGQGGSWATAESVPRLERAAAALEAGGGEAALRARAYCALAAALRVSGDWSRAAGVAEKATEVARTLGRGSLLARALRAAAFLRAFRREVAPAAAMLIEAEEMSREAGDVHGEAEALNLRGYFLIEISDLPSSLACQSQAESLWHGIGYRAGVASAVQGRGSVLEHQGEFAAALECYAAAEALYRELDDPVGLSRIQLNRGMVFDARGEHEEALRSFAESSRHMRRLGRKPALANLTLRRGISLFHLGDMRAASDAFDEAERGFQEIGERLLVVDIFGYRGHMLGRRGDWTGALAMFDRALEVVKALDRQGAVAQCRRVRARALRGLGRHEEARDELRESVRGIGDPKGEKDLFAFCALVELADVEQALGNRSEAARLTAEAAATRSVQERRFTRRNPELSEALETLDRLLRNRISPV
ncbi:MAG: tetratricopeptide repeat protein [Planctomycetes bacterium]|nr:tetratricopeptide repeat protein [Planctomycetota bacterium]